LSVLSFFVFAQPDFSTSVVHSSILAASRLRVGDSLRETWVALQPLMISPPRFRPLKVMLK